MVKTGADLAVHEIGVGVTEGNDVVEKRTGATDPDTDSDTAGDRTGSEKSATDIDSALSDTTDDGMPRKKNRRTLAVRRQMKRTARALADAKRAAGGHESDTDAGDESSPSDDEHDSDSEDEKKRHQTRALRLRQARRRDSRSARDVRKRQLDTDANTEDTGTSATDVDDGEAGSGTTDSEFTDDGDR